MVAILAWGGEPARRDSERLLIATVCRTLGTDSSGLSIPIAEGKTLRGLTAIWSMMATGMVYASRNLIR